MGQDAAEGGEDERTRRSTGRIRRLSITGLTTRAAPPASARPEMSPASSLSAASLLPSCHQLGRRCELPVTPRFKYVITICDPASARDVNIGAKHDEVRRTPPTRFRAFTEALTLDYQWQLLRLLGQVVCAS